MTRALNKSWSTKNKLSRHSRKKTSGKTSKQWIEHLIKPRRCHYMIWGQCWHLQMFLLIAASCKWKARDLSSYFSVYSNSTVFVDCKRQELSSTAFVHCSISKAIFSIINIHLFSGHPNFWAPQPLYTTSSRKLNFSETDQIMYK